MVDSYMKINFKKYNFLPLLIILFILVLSLPYMSRIISGNNEIIGAESYFNIRYAEEIYLSESATVSEVIDKSYETPDLVHSTRTFHFNAYHFLIALLSLLFEISIVGKILPFILGLLSLLIFSSILSHIGYRAYRKHIILLLLILSPAFIRVFTILSANSFIIFLSLLAVYLFIKDTKVSQAFSAICCMIIATFSLFNLIIVLLLVYFFASKKDKDFFTRKNIFVGITLLSFLVFFIYQSPLYYNYTSFESIGFWSSFFSDLGGLLGFGFFTVILAIIGLIVMWPKKKSLVLSITTIFMLVMYSYAGESVFIYLLFFMVVLAGEGLFRLNDVTWSFILLKHLTIFLIICGVLFSSVSYMDRISTSEGNPVTMNSLESLSSLSSVNDVVLTYPSNGYLVQYAGRTAFVDSLSTSNYNQGFLYKVADTVFHSRNLDETLKVLNAYNIKYIWITPDMRQGKVWYRDDEGLLFILKYSEEFTLIHEFKGYEIWRVNV